MEIDAARADRLAVLRDHAHGAAALDDNLADGGSDPDIHAALGCRFGHGLGDRAHAANGVAPGAFLAVDLAEHVMQQHVGRTRGIGTRVIADDAVESVSRLDGGALEPPVEIVAGGFDEQIQQLATHGSC